MCKLTLKREVFWLSLAYALMFSLAFILIIGKVLFNYRLSDMKEKLYGSNTQIITYMDTLFNSSGQMLRFLETTFDLTTQDPAEQEEIRAVFRGIQGSAPEIQFVFIGYADGSLLVNDYGVPQDLRATDRPWYREAVNKYPEYLIAFPYQEYVTKEWCFCTARAIAGDDGGIAAVVAVDFTVKTLYESALMRSGYDSQVNYLINRNGVCIYHPDKACIGTRIVEDPGNLKRFADEEGYIEYAVGGADRIGYFHHIAGSDSILVSSVNRGDVFVPALNAVINSTLGLLLLSLLASAAFMAVFDRRYVRPVKALNARLAALLAGKSVADAPGAYPNREFLEIANSMEELTKKTISQKAEELNAILESSSDGILVLDRNDRILHYNAQFLILWGLPRNKAYQAYGDLELDRRALTESACTHPTAQTRETELCYLKSGIILERHTRVLTEREHIDGILCIFRDATQKVKKEEQLKEIANTDFLTGLNNRRYFAFLAAREFRRTAESEGMLALLMIDIDNFKLINDTYGHDIGDRALKTFAMHLRQCSRRSDILGRYGGEEFCVLLPYTDADTANQIAERVRQHFENTAVDHKGGKIAWTISIGVANYGRQVQSVEVLIKHADIACYKAKQQGRNCVKAYGGEAAQTDAGTEREM